MIQTNKYTFYARFLPALISTIPLTFIYFFLTKKFGSYNLNEYIYSFSFIIGASSILILTFLVSMIVRELGNILEKRYFRNRLELPTNTIMLYQDDRLPKKSKDLYGQKIKADFKLIRYGETKEKINRIEALKILHQASRLICAKYHQHTQVKDANISYGFIRNLSGGLFISIPFSLIGFAIGSILNQKELIIWSAISAVFFGIILLFHKKWLKENAEKFAFKIITVYLSEELPKKSNNS